MLLWIHPIFQGLIAVLAVYVLWLGLTRAASRHFGRKTTFPRQRHVLLGKVVVVAWGLGALGGVTMTYLHFGKIYPESLHFRIGLVMVVLLVIAWMTGTRMDRQRNQSNVLPVVHLVNNALLMILAVVQLVTGIGIVRGVLLQ